MSQKSPEELTPAHPLVSASFRGKSEEENQYSLGLSRVLVPVELYVNPQTDAIIRIVEIRPPRLRGVV